MGATNYTTNSDMLTLLALRVKEYRLAARMSQKELAEQRDKFNTMKAQWENEKNAIGRVQQLREKIEQINREIETAQQNYDLEKAAKLMYHRPANRGAQPPSGRQAAAL